MIHKIEEKKFIADLPDRMYTTPKEIVSCINKMRVQLREDYGSLDFNELRKICDVGENGSFDECLDALSSQSSYVEIFGERIPKPLFRILEKLWRAKRIIAFPPSGYPNAIRQFFDRTCPEYEYIEDFFKEDKMNPSQLRKQVSSILKGLKSSPRSSIRFRSGISEIIRLLPKIRFTPQMTYYCGRYRKNPFERLPHPNVSSIKYVQERKSLPPRSISIVSFFSELRDIVENGYYCALKNEKRPIGDAFVPGKLLKSIKLVQQAFEDSKILGENGAFSDFQMNSTLHIFLNLFVDDTKCNKWCNEKTCRLAKKNLTIVADTGAGKTLAFIIAPLVYIVYKQLQDPGFRVAQKPICVLIYPRRDLAFDQHKTLQEMCSVINSIAKGEVRINVGCDYGGNIKYDGCLIASNIEAIKRRLADPVKHKYFAPDSLKVIVLDEVHLYSGILGLHVLYFLRRLGASLKEKHYQQHRSYGYTHPLMIGASATIALPAMHSRKLFSLGYDQRRESSLDRYRKTWVENAIREGLKGKRALFHHIFMLPKKLANLLGTLTDSTVGVLHNNPDRSFPQLHQEVVNKHGELTKEERSKITKIIGKSLLFVDSISAINRLSRYISDTEKRHLQVIGADGQTSRNFMCNTIYEKPIKFFPTFTILASKPNFLTGNPNLELMSNGPSICQFCKREREFEEVSLEQYLREGRDICTLLRYSKELQLNTILDGCFFFQTGLCWWLSEFPFIEVHNGFIPDQFTPDAVIPFRRTSSLREIMQEVRKLDELFVKIRDSPPYLQHKRLAVVSPVFEVGIDISNVKDVITFKTIRDLASYRQKTGRGGRELFSNTPIYTLISRRVLDRYIYRNPDIVADPSYLDPISLKEHNIFFVKAHIFMAIFDYLAIWSPEYLEVFQYRKLTRNPDLKRSNLLNYLEANEKRIKRYIEFTFRYYVSGKKLSDLIDKAIEEFKNRLNLFFADLPDDLQTKLGISKPISEDTRRINRTQLTGLASKARDPEEVQQNLKDLLEV